MGKFSARLKRNLLQKQQSEGYNSNDKIKIQIEALQFWKQQHELFVHTDTHTHMHTHKDTESVDDQCWLMSIVGSHQQVQQTSEKK